MDNILDIILGQKRKEVEELKGKLSFKTFESSPFFTIPTRSLKKRILEEGFGIIAEIKRKSPSAGAIREDLDPVMMVKQYETYGATGISVLTDKHFFGGSENDLRVVRDVTDLPILRKDFIIDEIQLFQAKAMGADIVLLIAEALTERQLLHFTIIAKELGLEVIAEFHEKGNLKKINDQVDIIGVNNRNLKTQMTSIQNSLDIFDLLPDNVIRISESGIRSVEELQQIKEIGFQGALIGESLLKEELKLNKKEISQQ